MYMTFGDQVLLKRGRLDSGKSLNLVQRGIRVILTL